MITVISRLFLIFFMFTMASIPGFSTQKFTVYAYLPWGTFTHKKHQDQINLLLSYGIKPIFIVYEKDYLTHQIIDRAKIKKLAEITAKNSTIPVSFDIELNNSIDPKIIAKTIESILQLYRQYNRKNLLGIYATIPKNTYGKMTNFSSYKKANDPYLGLINQVDFISPAFYNYNNNLKQWIKHALFTIKATQQLAPKKPIIPFISPVIRLGPSSAAKNGHLVEPISEILMTTYLTTLYHQGAAGCIIWASSQDRLADGTLPKFDAKTGWAKAVVDFIYTQYNG